MAMTTIKFELNGRPVALSIHPLKRLVDVLRDDLQLTGTKEGCGEGECGTCSVLLDNRLVNSCLVPVASVAGRRVTTIEGLRSTPRFDLLQRCFDQAGGVQCGFCTPGMIMAAEAILAANPHPSEKQVREGLAGNICRCTGYGMIIEAVLVAAREGGGLW